jgi:dynein heavy chain
MDTMTETVNNYQNLCKKLPKGLREWDAYKELKQTIDDFLEILPLLQLLSNKAIQPRHWSELLGVVGSTINLDPEYMKLHHLLGLHLLKHREELEEICNASVKELQIESKLNTIKEEWESTEFAFANFKNRGPVILKGQELGEIVEKLEESQMALGSMATNRYSAPFREDLQLWILMLSTVAEMIEQWSLVQNMWVYMEAVFSSGDIARQLPGEAKRFSMIDKNYIKIVSKALETRLVIPTCYNNEMMKTILPMLFADLELIQKSLTGYLETKRGLFPRFYFVSDPVLLDVLSQGSDPQAVQAHLQSVSDSLAACTFDRSEKNKILGFSSTEGESVQLSKPMQCQGNVEDWLNKLIRSMQETLKDLVRESARESASLEVVQLRSFIFGAFPAQCCLLGIQFQWTHDCQDALGRAKTDKTAMSHCAKKVTAVLSELVTFTTQDLASLERTNVETLITIQVHQKDVFDELVKKKVRDASDFDWLQQARFYYKWDKDDTIISIADVDFEYCYEFLGCKERLVITPLTDRCYITLSQALGMFLGGAPAGPAGTGKTETTKDLGRALGKFVVVFNCSDQMDFRAMGKIYKGLAMSGCWGCFDEFNRIDLEVLSVCAQQVQCILTAGRARQTELLFTDGQKITYDPKSGFFITMNPGYAGRQELPENLKSLFRGCAMMVPDRKIIMKVKLAACGYQENMLLCKKFHVLYRLCEQQLSKQNHYDFGLRNILSVLRTAGSTKRSNPDKAENMLLMRTLRDMNLSKFVAEDVPLFLSLLGDMFPGLNPEKATFPEVQKAIAKNVTAAELQLHKEWLVKVIQLYETYLVRHGIMLTGPAGGGKSTIMETLAKSLSDVNVKHTLIRMNPKAITAPQMFGRLDATTNDWTDGIFSVIWRKANKNKNQNTWIVLDGPVDAIWIENLNTVLDDNRLLTLANGDRIPMIPNVKAMFENENLNNASPATVSRAGIIYVSSSDLGWKPIVQSWLDKRKAAERDSLRTVFDKFLNPTMSGFKKEYRLPMQLVDINLVMTCLLVLEQLLSVWADTKEQIPEIVLEMYLLYALTWSVGAVLELEDRVKFDRNLRNLGGTSAPEQVADTVFEYFVDEPSHKWVHWRGRIPHWEYPEKDPVEFASLIVPTLDSVRYESIMHIFRMREKPVLMMGLQGVTKTTTVNQYLSTQKSDEFGVKNVTFSCATSPEVHRQPALIGSKGIIQCTPYDTCVQHAAHTACNKIECLRTLGLNRCTAL